MTQASTTRTTAAPPLDRYVRTHRQAFLPIFVSDRFDAVMLAEAGVEAGAEVIEMTCRREKVIDDIRRIKKAFPDLGVAVGSVVEDGPLLAHLRRRRPDFPSMDRIADLGVDGFVSFLPMSTETIAKFSKTHLVMPGVETIKEATDAVSAGAAFTKFFSTGALGGPRRVQLATSAAVHGLLPVFVTGGVTLDRVDDFMAAGAVMLGSGWDVILGDDYARMQDDPKVGDLAAALRAFIETSKVSRGKVLPLSGDAPPRDYVAALPHCHPFGAWRVPPPVPFEVSDPAELLPLLERHLLDDVMPFWPRHAVDDAGGINTCIADDGTLISRDKWFWSQWRAVWVFSELYRRIDRRQQWLDLARHVYRFCRDHGWDDEVGGWVLRTSHDGKVLDGCDSVYVDGFAIYGLTALSRATGDEEPLRLARKTARSMLKRLEAPHDRTPHFPYPVPAGARVHGIPMMFSLFFWELGEHDDDDELRAAAGVHADEIFERFYRPDRDVLVERVAADGSELPAPVGTAVVPGHVIEDMWFQAHIARDRGDNDRVDQAMRIMRRHLELGWDEEYGGILLAVDADGRSEVDWPHADTKLWWPHTEALYGLLLARQWTGADWAWDWYRRVHRYAFEHYPVEGHGEWRQKLDRRGRPITEVVALPVKDPFHLPRALILAVDLLREKEDSEK